MQLQTLITAALIGAVSAATGPVSPMITTAPEFWNETLNDTRVHHHTSKSCTSTDCWASYAECYGSLTFVYLCYTPPPCGTVTSPDPYSCPPPTNTHTTSKGSTTTLTIPHSTTLRTATAARTSTTFATITSASRTG